MAEKKMRSISMPPGPELNLALARTGYDIYQGINEIIDNSADAIKKMRHDNPDYKGNIYILTKKYDPKTDGSREVIIVDTGSGASSKTDEDIASVWSLGQSQKDKNTDEMYGVFGVGLKASVMKMAQFATFTSRNSTEDRFKTSVYSPAQQRAAGNWNIQVFDTLLEGGDQTEAWAVEKFLKNKTGSVVILRGIHDEFPVNSSHFYSKLKETLPRIYRGDLSSEIYEFQLGDTRPAVLSKKDIIDPLCDNTNIGEIKWYAGGPNQSETFKYKDYSFSLRVSHTVKGHGRPSRKNTNTLGSGIRGTYKRGVYFLRNGREIGIQTGDSSGYWNGLPSTSNFFVEVGFSDDGEDSSCPVQTDFGKKSINQSPDLVTFMKRKLEGIVAKVKAYKVEKLNKTDNQTKNEFEQCIEQLVQTPRKKATKGDPTRTKTEKHQSSVVKNINVPKAYRGKSNKEFTINYEDGYKSSVEICHTSCNMRRDFATWCETDVDGTVKIWLNEANSLVGKLVNKEITDPMAVLYLTLAPLALSSKEKLGNRQDNLMDELLALYGNMINQLSKLEGSIKDRPSAEIAS